MFRKADHLNKLLHRQESQGLKLAIEVALEMRKGCDFDVVAVAFNGTASEKKCRLLFSSMAVSYTGVVKDNCGFKDLLNVELGPGEGEQHGREFTRTFSQPRTTNRGLLRYWLFRFTITYYRYYYWDCYLQMMLAVGLGGIIIFIPSGCRRRDAIHRQIGPYFPPNLATPSVSRCR